jgi:cobalt-zinc-cadmium efflux system protein
MHGPVIHPESSPSEGSARKLMFVAILTASFMLVEFIGGVIANSLALISDAGHMFVDASGLTLAALAARFAAKPADPQRTFGYRRAEVLGAFLNGTLLCGLVLFIVFESIRRLFQPPEVDGPLMLWIAVGGLVFNLVAAAILLKGGRNKNDINMRGALLNVMGDALGSVGAIVAGIMIWLWGWMAADAVIGLLVAALISVNAIRLLRETVSILLESAPRHLDVLEIQDAVAELPGISSAHDIHVWSTAPGEETLTIHVVLEDDAALLRWDTILLDVNRLLAERWNLRHNIIQPERREELHEEIQHL